MPVGLRQEFVQGLGAGVGPAAGGGRAHHAVVPLGEGDLLALAVDLAGGGQQGPGGDSGRRLAGRRRCRRTIVSIVWTGWSTTSAHPHGAGQVEDRLAFRHAALDGRGVGHAGDAQLEVRLAPPDGRRSGSARCSGRRAPGRRAPSARRRSARWLPMKPGAAGDQVSHRGEWAPVRIDPREIISARSTRWRRSPSPGPTSAGRRRGGANRVEARRPGAPSRPPCPTRSRSSGRDSRPGTIVAPTS